jgi:hypothetical protein
MSEAKPNPPPPLSSSPRTQGEGRGEGSAAPPPAPNQPPPPALPQSLPGDGFFGWLGRQIGHIRQALHTDVAPPDSKTVWRDSRMEEKPSPVDPRVKLRRTVIDEVIVSKETPKIEKTPPKGS